MARIDRHKTHQKGAFYHLFNRGVAKSNIFNDQQDYFYYLNKIRKYKDLFKIEIINYNLMPSHYHYTVKQLSEIPISKFMHTLHTSYVYYFNKKYKRVGPLFQDRFKQRIISDEKYFLWLSAYINGNAQIHKIVSDVKNWQYSSYLDYIGLRHGTLCNINEIMKNFKNIAEYLEFVQFVIKECQNKKDALEDLQEMVEGTF